MPAVLASRWHDQQPDAHHAHDVRGPSGQLRFSFLRLDMEFMQQYALARFLRCFFVTI